MWGCEGTGHTLTYIHACVRSVRFGVEACAVCGEGVVTGKGRDIHTHMHACGGDGLTDICAFLLLHPYPPSRS